MRNALLILSTVLLLHWPMSSIAQEDFLKGYLYDANEKVPIPFATIQVKGWSKGVISNKNGSFRIPSQFGQLSDTLLISCMGYQSKRIAFSQFKADDANVIFLNPGVFQLGETVVKAKRKRRQSATQIVRRAIKNIRQNYSNDDFSLIGYYRDYQWHDDNYLNLNESLVEVFDHGFGTSDEWRTKYALYTVSKNQTFPRDSLSARPYDYNKYQKVIKRAFLEQHGGNELLILRIHDAIRNFDVNSFSFVHNMSIDFVGNHKFKREKDTYFENEPLYHITFTKQYRTYSAYGSMLISRRNYSIYKMDYALYDYAKTANATKSRHGAEGELLFEVTTEYRPFRNKMYLNYITFDNSFLMPLPPRFVVSDFVIKIDAGRIEVTFNEIPEIESSLSTKNYEIIYQGEKLEIDQLVLNPLNDKQLFIYPKFKHQVAKRSFYEYFRSLQSGEKESIAKGTFRYEVSDIRDIHGNEINQIYDFKKYQQYREFFTQEVRPNSKAAHGLPKMKKDLPVFSDKQPIVPKKDIDYFWMNTPLKGQSLFLNRQPNLLVTENR